MAKNSFVVEVTFKIVILMFCNTNTLMQPKKREGKSN